LFQSDAAAWPTNGCAVPSAATSTVGWPGGCRIVGGTCTWTVTTIVSPSALASTLASGCCCNTYARAVGSATPMSICGGAVGFDRLVPHLNGAPADERQAVERQVVADLDTHLAAAAEVARVDRHIQTLLRHAVPAGDRPRTIGGSLFDVGGARYERAGPRGFYGNASHSAIGPGHQADSCAQKQP